MTNLIDKKYDAEQKNSSNQEDDKSKSGSPTMFLYLRELFFLFALVFTSYTALFNSLPKVGKPPTPVPFFQRNSVVVDYYRGTVNAAFQRACEVDLTIVMYYAPWDADSQIARYQFESAAKFFSNEVFFTAINCWLPGSECKQHVPKIRRFPVILAYLQHRESIHYQGPFQSVYIIHFVKTLMRPIQRIFSTADIVHLTSQYNVVIVGAFLFGGSLGAAGYHTFYSTALKMLERDPFGEIKFAITTDQGTASALDFELVPSIRMYLWNETFDYPPDADYSIESLLKWILQKQHRAVQWVSPPKLKSYALSPFVINGPALILFTPRNPLIETNPMYNMLKEIAYRYHNCNQNLWVKHLSDFIWIKNNFLRFSEDKANKNCLMRKLDSERLDSYTRLPSVFVLDSFLNISKGDICDADSSYEKFSDPESNVCYRHWGNENSFCSKTTPADLKSDRNREYAFDVSEDPKSPKNLLEAWEDDKCKSMEYGNEYFKLPHPVSGENKSSWSINGLACSNNRTLSIIAMDSLFYYQFAEGLGINILTMKERTAVAIIDKKGDSQYIMNSSISKENLVAFIVNHTEHKLNRLLRSTHDSELRSLTRHRYPVKPEENCTHTDNESCVPELSSLTFLDYVMQQGRAVIVFYHSPYCGLCRSVSYLFLLISRYFRYFPSLKFVRIDGDNNDLPWEYTMDLFPSLLFFPTFRKSESRIYSSNLPFTIRNLIHFVLGNLEPEAKIPAMMSLCLSFEKLQSESEARKCKSKIQKHLYDYLSNTLKEIRRVINVWRHLSPTSKFVGEIRKRKELLIRKLEYFKTNHFLLGSVDAIQQKSSIINDTIKLYLKFVRYVKSDSCFLGNDFYR